MFLFGNCSPRVKTLLKTIRILCFALAFFVAGMVTGASLLLFNPLPLSAIYIDMRTGTFRFKVNELLWSSCTKETRIDGR